MKTKLPSESNEIETSFDWQAYYSEWHDFWQAPRDLLALEVMLLLSDSPL